MHPDPNAVDLSFVDPPLRDAVRGRIAALERFLTTPGPDARRAACMALGVTEPQLRNLARAWRARRRAEDLIPGAAVRWPRSRDRIGDRRAAE